MEEQREGRFDETMEMGEIKASGSGEQGEYDNDRATGRPLIEDLNGDNQNPTEGGDSLDAGDAGSSVSGPSRDTVVEGGNPRPRRRRQPRLCGGWSPNLTTCGNCTRRHEFHG